MYGFEREGKSGDGEERDPLDYPVCVGGRDVRAQTSDDAWAYLDGVVLV